MGAGTVLFVAAMAVMIGAAILSFYGGKETEYSRVPLELEPGQTAIVLNQYFTPLGNIGCTAQMQDTSQEIFTFDSTRVVSGKNDVPSGGNRLPEKGDIVVADKNQQVMTIGTTNKTTTENPPGTP